MKKWKQGVWLIVVIAVFSLLAACNILQRQAERQPAERPSEPAVGQLRQRAEEVQNPVAVCMQALAAEDVEAAETVSGQKTAAEELLPLLHQAAESPAAQAQLLCHFYLDVYLDRSGEYDRRLSICAGLTENLLRVTLFDGAGGQETAFFADPDLYRLVRGLYRTKDEVDGQALELYRDILYARAQQIAAETRNMDGEPAFIGFELAELVPVDVFTEDGETFEVYRWEPAFLSEAPDRVVLAGGMSVDGDGRVRGLEECLYFAVRQNGGGARENRFFFWDLYAGETAEQGRKSAREEILRQFRGE